VSFASNTDHSGQSYTTQVGFRSLCCEAIA
jgi:hypothetical protein